MHSQAGRRQVRTLWAPTIQTTQTTMKLFPKSPRDVRVNTEDSLGHGMDAVIMLAIFLGAGYGLDRVLGTVPIFMIVMTVVGSVGLFARFYYQYANRMDEHEAVRVAKLGAPSIPVVARGAAATATTTATSNGEVA